MIDIEKIWNKYSSSVIAHFCHDDKNFRRGVVIEYSAKCPEFLDMNVGSGVDPDTYHILFKKVIDDKNFYQICDKIVHDTVVNNVDYSEQYRALKNSKPQIKDLVFFVEDLLFDEWSFRIGCPFPKEVIDNFEKIHLPLLNLHNLTTKLWEKEKIILLHWSGSAPSDGLYKISRKYDKYTDCGAKCILAWYLDGMLYEENIKLPIIGMCPKNKNLDYPDAKRVILGYMCLKVIPILDECNVRHRYVKWGEDVHVAIILDALK